MSRSFALAIIGLSLALSVPTAHGFVTSYLPASEPESTANPIPARSFSSKLAMQVWVITAKAERSLNLGSTGDGRTISIPACRMWWVTPTKGVPVADVVNEVRAQSIPSMELMEATDDDIALFKDLPALQWLQLDHSKVTGAGLEKLKDQLPGLIMLNLERAKVTEIGRAHV